MVMSHEAPAISMNTAFELKLLTNNSKASDATNMNKKTIILLSARMSPYFLPSTLSCIHPLRGTLNKPLKNAPSSKIPTNVFGPSSANESTVMQILRPIPPRGTKPNSMFFFEMTPATQHPKPIPTAITAMTMPVWVLENPSTSGQWIIKFI